MFFRKTNEIDKPPARLVGEGEEEENVNKQNISERMCVQLCANKLDALMSYIILQKNVKMLKVA